jgi:hypothetical protein
MYQSSLIVLSVPLAQGEEEHVEGDLLILPSGPSTIGGAVVGGSLATPELHLTCMKTVGSLAGCVGCGTSTGISDVIRPALRLAMMAAIAVVALVIP